MGRRPRLLRPNVVLGRAKHAGLMALVNLLGPRASGGLAKYHCSASKMWDAVRAALRAQEGKRQDYLVLNNTEPNMRKSFLQFVWHSTVPYGNTELKRVYDWTEGTVGPLNALLNYAGARLRDLAMTRYPFPEPRVFQIARFPDGTVKVYSLALVNRLKAKGLYPPDDFDKNTEISWKAGYSGTTKTPQVYLAHPTLPSLDFVDMIRAHVVELCRQCFIYSVPRTEAHRYIRLLIHRLRPFLDWVYTERATGRPNFNRDANRELREIVLEIRALYGLHAGQRQSITRSLDIPSPITLGDIRKAVKCLPQKTVDEGEMTLYQSMKDQIDAGTVVERDADKLTDQLSSSTSQEGNRWHRILLSGFHHPASLKQVVFAGDTMLDQPSSVLAVAELPVDSRRGQADLVFFLRRELEKRTIWTPIMILEVKTKSAFDINLYGVEVGSREENEYAPAFFAWKRALTGGEWNALLTSPPKKSTKGQLDAYEQAIIREYKRTADFDPTPPTSLWKGVIVLDADQIPIDAYSAFQTLIENLLVELTGDTFQAPPKTISQVLDTDSILPSPRVALLLLPDAGPDRILSQRAPPAELVSEDPFADRITDDRILTVYVSVPTPTSSGKTSAWQSSNWHLLHHIRECREASSQEIGVFWLDLLGDYQTGQLTNLRFGLDRLLAEKRISRSEHGELVAEVEAISFVDLHVHTEKLLRGENQSIEGMLTTICNAVETEGEKIIVVDGWDELRKMIPTHSRHLLRTLEVQLLDTLPSTDTNIIWIDTGTEDTLTSADCQRGCIKPFRHDSPRRTHLDEVIYNLPSPPRIFGNLTPWREDVRVIVQDTPTSALPWRTTIHVPHLVGAAERFRGASSRHGSLSQDDVARHVVNDSRMYARSINLSSIQSGLGNLTMDTLDRVMEQSCSLVPSLYRARDGHEQQPQEALEIPQILVQGISSARASTQRQRFRFQPARPPPDPVRSKDRYVESGKITRRWFYERNPTPRPEIPARPRSLCRPPVPSELDAVTLDSCSTRRWELKRFLTTARYLAARPLGRTLKGVCEEIADLCQDVLSDSEDTGDGDAYLDTLSLVRDIILSETSLSQVWESLRPGREQLLDLLNSDNRKRLETITKEIPDALLLYGNNLFLMVCAAAQEENSCHYETLWAAVAEWTFYQMGLRSRDSSVTSKYDLHTIYRSLRSRARTLSDRNIPETSLSQASTGQIIWWEEGDSSKGLLVFPDQRGEMVSGLVTTGADASLRPRWYRCDMDAGSLREYSRSALSSEERTTIMLSDVAEHRILWLPSEDDEWWPYLLTHGYPDKNQRTIPWLRVTDPFTVPDITQGLLIPPTPDSDPGQAVDQYLRELGQLERPVTPVKLEVSVDPRRGVYVVQFTGDGISVEEEFSDTDELVGVLRYPIRRGVGYDTAAGAVTWDHKEDITYTDDSLTCLIPLVLKSRFLPDHYSYPESCAELLAASAGGDVTLTIWTERSGSGFRLQLQGLEDDSPLRSLEEASPSLYEVGLLAECEQLIDTKNRLRHEVELDVSGHLDLSASQVERYPALSHALAEVDRDAFDWSRGSWGVRWSYVSREDRLTWSIVELSSRRAWLDQTYTFQPDPSSSVDTVLEAFKQDVAAVVPLGHLDGLEDSMAELRDELESRGWRDTPPICRGEVQHGVEESTLVISRVERDGSLKRVESISLTAEGVEELLEVLDHEEFRAWPYSLENQGEVQEALKAIREGADLSDMAVNEDDVLARDYEEVITEYREEALEAPEELKYLAKTLIDYGQFRAERGHLTEALQLLEEGVSLLREENLIDIIVLQALARGLILRAHCLLHLDIERQDETRRDLEESRGLLEQLRKRGENITVDTLTTKMRALERQIRDDSNRVNGR